ncbi:MAG: YchJ family protein [Pseudomonadota bacterium]
MTRCPCDSGLPAGECCEPILQGDEALTAVALMRSRYTAYVREDAEYLLYSWHPRTRPREVRFPENQKWLGLAIKRQEAGGEQDEEGLVEFVARFKIAGRGHRMHEISRFTRFEGRWVYLDAE